MIWKRRPGGPPVPPDMPVRLPLRILAVSDVESKFIWEHFDPELFRGVDLILSCGDLKASYLSYLVTMIPAPLFYVHGNHDDDYARRPPLGCECVDGRVVEYKGLRIAGLGGCMGTDPRSAFQYSEAEMEKRVRRLESGLRRDRKLDIFVSHAPASGMGDGAGFHEGFRCFHEIHRDNAPRYHLFGHIHMGGSPVPGSRQGVYLSGATTAVNCAGYRFIDV